MHGGEIEQLCSPWNIPTSSDFSYSLSLKEYKFYGNPQLLISQTKLDTPECVEGP